MKKLFTSSLLALAALAFAGSAQAVEVGASAGRVFQGGASASDFGVSVGEKFGRFGVEARFNRVFTTDNDQNRFALVGSADLVTLGPVTASAKLGGSYVDYEKGRDGRTVLAGVGVSLPVTKAVRVEVEGLRQFGEKSIRAQNANLVSASVKYTF